MDDWWWMMDDGWWMMMMDDEDDDDDDDEEEEEDKDDGDDGDDEWSLYDHFNNSNKEVPIMWWNKWASSSMTTARSEPTKLQVKNGWKGCLFHLILLMEEILHHLRYIKIIKPCKSWVDSQKSTGEFAGILNHQLICFKLPPWVFLDELQKCFFLHSPMDLYRSTRTDPATGFTRVTPQKFHELITNNSHSLKPETHLFQGGIILA